MILIIKDMFILNILDTMNFLCQKHLHRAKMNIKTFGANLAHLEAESEIPVDTRDGRFGSKVGPIGPK